MNDGAQRYHPNPRIFNFSLLIPDFHCNLKHERLARFSPINDVADSSQLPLNRLDSVANL